MLKAALRRARAFLLADVQAELAALRVQVQGIDELKTLARAQSERCEALAALAPEIAAALTTLAVQADASSSSSAQSPAA
jgi:hypothetical protein